MIAVIITLALYLAIIYIGSLAYQQREREDARATYKYARQAKWAAARQRAKVMRSIERQAERRYPGREKAGMN